MRRIRVFSTETQSERSVEWPAIKYSIVYFNCWSHSSPFSFEQLTFLDILQAFDSTQIDQFKNFLVTLLNQMILR